MAENVEKFVHGAGATLSWSLNGSTGWTVVDDLTDSEMPELKMDRIGASTLATPNKFKRVLPGWGDPGAPRFVIALTRAQLNTLLGHFFSRARLYWRSFYPDAIDETDVGYLAYRAWIESVKPGTNITRESTDLILCEVGLAIESITTTADFYVGTSP